MNIKSKVLYQEKEYVVLFIYNNGFCEIEDKRYNKVQLVHMSELTELD